jgi:hypothetical protein
VFEVFVVLSDFVHSTLFKYTHNFFLFNKEESTSVIIVPL